MIISSIDYQKLEKVEVSGLMGRWYSPMVERVYHRFQKYMEKMISLSYDPLDFLNEVNNNLFLEDYKFYLNMSDDIDNRLATISKACFENCNDLMSIYKVVFRFFFFVSFLIKKKKKIMQEGLPVTKGQINFFPVAY